MWDLPSMTTAPSSSWTIRTGGSRQRRARVFTSSSIGVGCFQLRELCSEKSTSQSPCYCNQSDHSVPDESVYSTTPITTANRKATPMPSAKSRPRLTDRLLSGTRISGGHLSPVECLISTRQEQSSAVSLSSARLSVSPGLAILRWTRGPCHVNSSLAASYPDRVRLSMLEGGLSHCMILLGPGGVGRPSPTTPAHAATWTYPSTSRGATGRATASADASAPPTAGAS